MSFYALSFGVNRSENTNILSAFFASITGMLVALLTIGIDRYCLAKIFPPISFLWGENTRNWQKMEKLRSNFFWVIIVGLVFAIFGPQISKLFFHN